MFILHMGEIKLYYSLYDVMNPLIVKYLVKIVVQTTIFSDT